MSISAFGRLHGVSAQRLGRWRKLLSAHADERVADAPMFVPAKVSSTTACVVAVYLPGGVTVEAADAAAISPSWVAALARELAGR